MYRDPYDPRGADPPPPRRERSLSPVRRPAPRGSGYRERELDPYEAADVGPPKRSAPAYEYDIGFNARGEAGGRTSRYEDEAAAKESAIRVADLSRNVAPRHLVEIFGVYGEIDKINLLVNHGSE